MRVAGHVRAILPLALAGSALALRLWSSDAANLSYLLLAGYALLGREQAIEALGLSWLFTMMSPGVAPEATLSSIARYFVIATAALSVFSRSGFTGSMRISRPVFATCLFGLFLVGHSLLFSPLSDVSVLKAVSWTVTMVTLLAAWRGLNLLSHARLERQMFGGLIVILLTSLFLLDSEIGYLRNETGFQGILQHPQVFGPAMALLSAWLTARMMARARPSLSGLAVLFVAVLSIVLSESRTAGLALVLGVVCGVALAVVAARVRLPKVLPAVFSSRAHAIALAGLIGLLIAGPTLKESIWGYFQKRTQSNTFAEAYEASRGEFIRDMWANIERAPMRGISFGIASDFSSMRVERDPWLGLPVAANIEKGVMPVAVLEEVGIPGFLVFLAWLWVLAGAAARAGPVHASVFCTVLILNLGEATLFSPGGLGLLNLLLLSWSVAFGHRSQSPERPAV